MSERLSGVRGMPSALNIYYRGLILRIGFGYIIYYTYSKNPQNSIGSYSGPYMYKHEDCLTVASPAPQVPGSAGLKFECF